jgi:hypothetical protein
MPRKPKGSDAKVCPQMVSQALISFTSIKLTIALPQLGHSC